MKPAKPRPQPEPTGQPADFPAANGKAAAEVFSGEVLIADEGAVIPLR